MKKYILQVLFLCFSAGLTAQSAFHDAIKLREFIKAQNLNGRAIAKVDPQNNDFVSMASPILALYTANPNEINNIADLRDEYAGNPFISGDSQSSFIVLPNTFQAPAESAITDAASVPSAGSGLFVTNLADGLAKFLVKRTKEELTVTFFQKFKKKLNDTPTLKQLFPQTTDLLDLIDKEIYQFNAYMETLREHFIKDLKTLPFHLREKLQEENLLNPDKEIIAEDLLAVGQMLIDGETPTGIIDFLANESSVVNTVKTGQLEDEIKKKFEDAAAGLKVVDLFSKALRSNVSDELWIKPRELKLVLENKITRYLFLGLIWQKAAGIKFSNGKNVQSILNDVANGAEKIEKLERQISLFLEYGNEVKVSLDSIKAKKSRKELVYDDFFQFFQSSIAVLKTGIRFKQNLVGQSANDFIYDNQIFKLLLHFNELNFNIRQKHYASAITNLARILEGLLPEDKFKFKDELLKYGNFIAIVAEAETSDEVAAAIEAVALPVGSSITKKYSTFSVALNAYPGIAGGEEKLQESGDKGFFSMTAPIGISFNVGMQKVGSIGLFTSIIDIGAITAFRFDDENTQDLPELDIQNILAPGAYLVYGFGGDIPLSLGFGGQMGPNLRKIEASTTALEISDRGWRWGFFLAVDIPLINLYVR